MIEVLNLSHRELVTDRRTLIESLAEDLDGGVPRDDLLRSYLDTDGSGARPSFAHVAIGYLGAQGEPPRLSRGHTCPSQAAPAVVLRPRPQPDRPNRMLASRLRSPLRAVGPVNSAYDREGQLLSASFMDYCIPRADDLPDFAFEPRVTPSPGNPLDVKGCGEAGAAGSPPAAINALLDALASAGVADLDMPATPERVWRALRAARPAAAPDPERSR